MSRIAKNPWVRSLLPAVLALALGGCGHSASGADAGLPAATIAGTVIGSNGVAVSGAQLFIDGASATTDASGAFSLPGVKRPYDLLAVVGGATPVAAAYLGLTATAPVITLQVQPNPLTATVSGTLTMALDASDGFEVIAGGPNVTGGVPYSTPAGLGGGYNVTVDWSGGSAENVTLYALQYTPNTGLPTSYGGFGQTTAQVASNATVPETNIPISNVTPGTISGSITVPDGYFLASASLSFIPGPGALFQFDQTSPTATFSVPTPDVPGASFIYAATATSAAGDQSTSSQLISSANQSGVTVALHAAPTLTSPPQNQLGVSTTTKFAWSDSEHGCVYWLQATSAQSGAPLISILTTALTAQLPDLSAASVQIPASAQYTWQVTCLAPYTSVDAAATGTGLSGAPEIDQSASQLFAAQ